MYAQIFSSALWGISAKIVEVEVDVSRGLPQFCIVGLPDAAVKESRDRVITALRNSQILLPARRITVNLAPANLRKEGPAFDLPIALALLAATEQIPLQALRNHLVFGELSLDGRICPVRGALSLVSAAGQRSLTHIMLPQDNYEEVGILPDCRFLPVQNLLQAIDYFHCPDSQTTALPGARQVHMEQPVYDVDFSEVHSQAHAKRALEVAAAGSHNVLMIGPPGSGKTMLTQRMPTILPAPTLSEALDTTKLYSIAERLPPNKKLLTTRPFRAPHHTVSDIALIGGGSYPKPGEVSLAHNGVLFLDELPEFSKNALEVLRQPLEDRVVTISRTRAAVTFPANFMLLAAMNPCPCGYYTDPKKNCSCTPHQIQKYLARISGPLLDRFDIHLEVPALPYKELTGTHMPEASQTIRQRVVAAREVQNQRFQTDLRGTTNAQLSPRQLRQYCRLDHACHQLLKTAIDKMGLSARAFHRILKVSRTIADLEQSEEIGVNHVSEAIQYRSLDKQYWGTTVQARPRRIPG